MTETSKQLLPHETSQPEGLGQSFCVDAEAVFNGFDWREGTKPDALALNDSGFFEDTAGYWYLARKAQKAIEPDLATPQDLYNGTKAQHWNSTEGSGLYFANYPQAVRNLKIAVRPSKEPKELYICRIKPEADQLLDVTASLKGKAAGQKAAALLLRSRGIFPGIPSPNRSTYDRMYGDANIIATPPLALARLMSGRRVQAGDTKLKPRWVIVRDIAMIDVVAHLSLAQETI